MYNSVNDYEAEATLHLEGWASDLEDVIKRFEEFITNEYPQVKMEEM